MVYCEKRSLDLLRLGTGHPNATFREGQENAIRHVVEGRGRLLVVQKTGWGKSFVYFIAVKLLREGGLGPALLVSPLLALMRNQIAAAERMGVSAYTINSDNQEEWDEVEVLLLANKVDILLISPERFANERFRSKVLENVSSRISLLVIDEAHCISDWGHDFRPHYRLITRIAQMLPANLRLLATTATANNRVIEDLQQTLGPALTISRGSLGRPSLFLQTISMPNQADRLAWLAEQVPQMPGSGIIYTLTVRDAEQVAQWLQHCGICAQAYTGETGEQRPALEQALLNNEMKVLVATTALGMGFDKPDLAFVIHYQLPGSVVAYYQQVGRAGRALDAAYCVVLSGSEDTEITDYFIQNAFPTQEEVEKIISALESEPEGLSTKGLMEKVNIRYARIEKAMALLSLESPAPVVKQGYRWQLTPTPLDPSFWKRAERLTALRYQEQQEMKEYINLKSGHMAFLIKALDGDPEGITSPQLPALPENSTFSIVQKAVEFLRRSSLDIEPRKIWPSGGLPVYGLKGKIAEEYRALPGKALSVWGDAGWGGLVRQGKYKDNHFSDELVEASRQLLLNWHPEPTPEWITCVPSSRHPELLPDFCERLGQRLGLPFRVTMEKERGRPEQKTMANSVQQARNLDNALSFVEMTFPQKPVLLVDDMVDSRWTMTVASWLLRFNGCGEVLPFALALTGYRK